jgi:HPr kinase/phosphorylase
VGEHESCPIPSLAVRDLLTDETAEPLQLELLAGGAGLDNIVNRSAIQRPGLALAGFLEYVSPGRVQVLGKSEINFLNERPAAERTRILAQLCRQGGSCFVLTAGLKPPPELVAEAERHQVPLLRTAQSSTPAIEFLTSYLQDRLAPRAVLHGVLLDVYGLGVLLVGESGVGKSESALDLVVRGHRLVSDDVVEIKRCGEILVGSGPELTRYHMELRGVGIIKVKDLFGVASVRMTKNVEYVIRLDTWDERKSYERLGLDERSYEILGIELPFVEMPVRPGRNLSVLIEVAARNHLLKRKGYHPARQLARLLGRRLRRGLDALEEEDLRAASLGPEPEDGEI